MKTICEAFLDEAMEYNDLPGLVIGVFWDGETFTGARGVRDVVTGDPLQADDVFHCASVSKLFTSTAIMKLVDAGILNLDDRLCDILPELFDGNADSAKFNHESNSDKDGAFIGGAAGNRFSDPRWQDVRLWQMLSHTAGIGDVDDYHWEQALTGETALSDYVHSPEVTGQPLLWAPGTGGFRYSNIAYEILGHIVSRKSGEYIKTASVFTEDADVTSTDGVPVTDEFSLSYEAFVRKYLMEPAGMQNSTMLTFERFGAKAGHASEDSFDGLITDEIRRRNAAGDGAAAGPSAGQPADQNPAWQPADRYPAGQPADQYTAGQPMDWHPMALPHEKAADRSIIPVKYYPYTRCHAPSSTLTSTAADLLKWAQVHLEGFADVRAAEAAFEAGLIPEPASARQPNALLTFNAYQHIHYEYAEVPNNREKMGLGWFMRRQGGHQLYGHEGTDDGFRASLWICPDLNLSIVVLSNLSGAPVKKLNKKLFDRLV